MTDRYHIDSNLSYDSYNGEGIFLDYGGCTNAACDREHYYVVPDNVKAAAKHYTEAWYRENN